MMTDNKIIKNAKEVLHIELAGIKKLSKTIDKNFVKAVKKISQIKGRVIITGVGKSGHIASKLSSTMSSTGTPSQYSDPTSMSHGDLGIITKKDILIIISNSGKSSELFNLLDYAKKNSINVIGISSNLNSELIKSSTIPLILPSSKEACSIGLAPTTSTSMALVLGDALCVSLMKLKKFNINSYRKIHPGGALGINMLQVKNIMHSGRKIPLVKENAKMKAVIIEMTKKSFGHVGVINKSGQLVGVITDGDLRRNLNSKFLEIYAKKIMTVKPELIIQKELMVDALKIMNKNKITCLFVTESKLKNRPIGIIHIHDCLRFTE